MDKNWRIPDGNRPPGATSSCAVAVSSRKREKEAVEYQFSEQGREQIARMISALKPSVPIGDSISYVALRVRIDSDPVVKQYPEGFIPAPCAPAMHVDIESGKPKRKWILDTGSPYDLVDIRFVGAEARRTLDEDRALHLETANGLTRANQSVLMQIEDLEGTPAQTITAHALESSPDVISLGKLCRDYKFTFCWDGNNGRDPYLKRPDGRVIPCGVENYLPYLYDGGTSRVYV